MKYNLKFRIQKILSHYGLGSRRYIEKLIKKKKILINNKILFIGQKIYWKNKINIKINNKNINLLLKKIKKKLIMYNKLKGELVSKIDIYNRPLVFDKLPKNYHWYSIGRLDFNTEGLLLFTNLGDYANKLMHPRYNIEREYIININKKLLNKHYIYIYNVLKYKYFIKKIFFINKKNKIYIYNIILYSGKNRAIHKIFNKLNIIVIKIKRIRFGKFKIPKNLKKGNFIYLI